MIHEKKIQEFDSPRGGGNHTVPSQLSIIIINRIYVIFSTDYWYQWRAMGIDSREEYSNVGEKFDNWTHWVTQTSFTKFWS